jgi:hypothetical protein
LRCQPIRQRNRPPDVSATRAGLQPVGKSTLEDSNYPLHLDSRGGVPHHNRRLSDKLLLAFHQACDQQDALLALQLLNILESMVTRRPRQVEFSNRRSLETLVAAHERLWHIRHPVDLDQGDLVGQPSGGRKEIHYN